MAVNEVDIRAAPEQVFALFADGKRYADWVVGAKNIRSVDPGWPKVGSRLHHTVGLGRLELKDNTEVVEVQAPERLVLLARFRPLGRARVRFVVTPNPDGSHLRMEETVLRAPPWLQKVLDPTIQARNAEALRRLRNLVEEGSAEE